MNGARGSPAAAILVRGRCGAPSPTWHGDVGRIVVGVQGRAEVGGKAAVSFDPRGEKVSRRRIGIG